MNSQPSSSTDLLVPRDIDSSLVMTCPSVRESVFSINLARSSTCTSFSLRCISACVVSFDNAIYWYNLSLDAIVVHIVLHCSPHTSLIFSSSTESNSSFSLMPSAKIQKKGSSLWLKCEHRSDATHPHLLKNNNLPACLTALHWHVVGMWVRTHLETLDAQVMYIWPRSLQIAVHSIAFHLSTSTYFQMCHSHHHPMARAQMITKSHLFF